MVLVREVPCGSGFGPVKELPVSVYNFCSHGYQLQVNMSGRVFYVSCRLDVWAEVTRVNTLWRKCTNTEMIKKKKRIIFGIENVQLFATIRVEICQKSHHVTILM